MIGHRVGFQIEMRTNFIKIINGVFYTMRRWYLSQKVIRTGNKLCELELQSGLKHKYS